MTQVSPVPGKHASNVFDVWSQIYGKSSRKLMYRSKALLFENKGADFTKYK